MKKILLASTILAGTAGFAAADNANFTFSGEAYTGLAFSFGDEAVGADPDGDGVTGEADVTVFQPEVYANFTVAMMTTTDGGLEAGAKFDIDGFGVFVEDDHTEGNFGSAETENGGIGDVEVYLSGEWGKFEADYEGGKDVDFIYTNSFGDFDIEIWYEYVFGQDNDEYGAEGTYNFADYSVWAGVEYQQDLDGGNGGFDVWVGASASMNGFSGEVEVNYENISEDWDWYAEVGYAMDAYSFGAFIEDDGTDDDIDFGVNASYDLGGGVSVDAAYVYDADLDVSVAKAGVSMSF